MYLINNSEPQITWCTKMSNEKTSQENTEQESTEEIVRRVLSEHYGEIETEERQIETPKRSWIWMKNSSGESSASITFLFIAFWVTTFIFIIGHIGEINVSDKVNLTFNGFDSTAAAVYYVPLMMLYFKRREFESEKPGKPGLLELALSNKSNNSSD